MSKLRSKLTVITTKLRDKALVIKNQGTMNNISHSIILTLGRTWAKCLVSFIIGGILGVKCEEP